MQLPTLITTTVLGLGLATPAAPAASATPTGLMTPAQVGEVHPTFTGGSRYTYRGPHYAPDRADGCDGSLVLRAPVQRWGAFQERNLDRQRGPLVNQHVLRYRSVAQAAVVLDQYRSYLADCSGIRETTDGNGAPATASVRAWRLPRVGAASVSMIDLFAYGRERQWTGTVVTRVGTSVTVVEVTPTVSDRQPGRAKAVRLARIAASNLG